MDEPPRAALGGTFQAPAGGRKVGEYESEQLSNCIDFARRWTASC